MPSMLILTVFLALLGTVCGPGRSVAQVPAAVPSAVIPPPDRTTASYGDWVLRCELKASSERSCEVAQSVQDAQGQLLAQIIVRRASQGATLLLTVQVGVNIAVSEPARIMLDDQAALNVAFRRCLPRGCFAELLLPRSDALAVAQRAEAARVEYRGADGGVLTIPISLRGLASSLEALRAAEPM